MPQSVAKQDFIDSLTALGVVSDDLVMVHASMKSFGYFDGGPEAAIDALMAVLGQGTLAMPTYTARSKNQDPERDRIEYNPATEPSIDGIITEKFRLRPDVIRQASTPHHPISFWGARQKALLETPMYGVYQYFLENNGKTLTIGIGHEAHSFVHSIVDDLETAGLMPTGAAKKTSARCFPRLEPWYLKAGAQKDGSCGNATLRLTHVAQAREAAMDALKEQPDLLLAPLTEAEAGLKNDTA